MDPGGFFNSFFCKPLKICGLKILLYRKIVVTFQSNKSIGDKAMARPIAETPILTGEDAIRFERLRKEVDSLTKEQRAENTRKLKEAVAKAKQRITICI